MIGRKVIGRKLAIARNFSSAVTFAAHGAPQAVLKFDVAAPLEKLGAHDVAVKILASPINPADINTIEGTYGSLPKLPAVAGKECVAVVEEVGREVKTLTAGDRVVSCGNLDFGAWRNKGVSNELDFLKVSETLPIPYAATILVNPCTAYRMLTDFVKLSPGDYIIQNAANSMVGMAVIQMARMRGIRTINVIRSDRPNADDAVRLCENLGGDINVLDTFVGTAAFNEILSELPPIKLALNAVGGDSATELSRALGVNGHMVTYGGMSKKPMNIPVDVLVEKSLNLHGFWISQWHQDKNNHKARSDMIADITSMINNDQLTFFYEMHDFDDFQYALNRSMEPFNLRKIVLNMDFPDRFKEHDTKTEEDYWHFKAPNDV